MTVDALLGITSTDNRIEAQTIESGTWVTFI